MMMLGYEEELQEPEYAKGNGRKVTFETVGKVVGGPRWSMLTNQRQAGRHREEG